MVRWASAPAHIAESIFGALNQLTGYRILISSKGLFFGIFNLDFNFDIKLNVLKVHEDKIPRNLE